MCETYYQRLVFMIDLGMAVIGTDVHPLTICEVGILLYSDFLPLPHKNEKETLDEQCSQ